MTAKKGRRPEGMGSMLGAPKAFPDKHIERYFHPEFAKDAKGLSPSRRQEGEDASRFDGQVGGTEARGALLLSSRSNGPTWLHVHPP